MLHLAIVGAGPAGYYTAEAAAKRWGAGVRIDMLDASPAPFGLIRSGVAPDHQAIKAVARRYAAVALEENVRFLGHVMVERDITLAELAALYDAVVLATGAPQDRVLAIPGAELGNVFGSAAFVGWYNGHPSFADLAPDFGADFTGAHAVVIGNGNVALDVARILAKTPEEFAGSDIVGHALTALSASRLIGVTLLGRRGPHQIAMTPKELGELGQLARARAYVSPGDLPPLAEEARLEPGQRKAVACLRGFAAAPKTAGAEPGFTIAFDFFAAPRALIGEAGRVVAVEVERTRLEGARAVGTGEVYRIPASLVITCIGYRAAPIAGVAYDEAEGRFANTEGRIAPGLYCVGWARRGPSGTIGTNRPDGQSVVEVIAADLPAGGGAKLGGAGFDALAAARGLELVSFRDWQAIDAAEIARARPGAPREKFTDEAAMLRVAHPEDHPLAQPAA